MCVLWMKTGMRSVNVLQRQYAISSDKLGRRILSTKGIVSCTGLYGWDEINKVSFLCHFDDPMSANSTPEILKQIRSQVSNEHYFEAYLIGGKGWLWSRYTRGRIKKLVSSQQVLNISVREIPFNNFFLALSM